MILSPIEMIGLIAGALADSDGPRQGCERIVASIARAIRARLAFVALAGPDNSVADLLAAHGLGAADFRRLESRLPRSRLWAVMKLAAPVAVDDASADRSLDCLAFGGGARLIVAVPILLRGTPAGLVAGGCASGSPVDEDEVIRVLEVIAALIAQELRVHELAAAEAQQLEDENLQLSQALRERYDFGQLIGNSGPMRHVFSLVTQVARTNSSVLLRGEPGTGKELIANAIHYNSLRRKRAFVAVNCRALPEGSAGHELFGEGPGARRKGRIESANGGTLLLEEVGDLPVGVQRRVAEALAGPRQEGALQFNVRLIASTSRDLETAIASGRFDRAFFDLLSPFSIFLPPLRERKQDIEPLVRGMTARFNRKFKKDLFEISPEAMSALQNFHWPGNIRQLENVIQQAVLVSSGPVLMADHLPPQVKEHAVLSSGNGPLSPDTLAGNREQSERTLIQRALHSNQYSRASAAKALGISRVTLYKKMKKYGLMSIPLHPMQA